MILCTLVLERGGKHTNTFRMNRFLQFSAISLLIAGSLRAQKSDFEQVLPLQNKAIKGYLAESVYQSGAYHLSYVSPMSAGQIRIYHYVFDDNLLPIAQDSTEMSLDEAKGKFAWFKKYRGEQYSVWTVEVSKSAEGMIAAKRKLINFRWSWKQGEYIRSVKILEAFTPSVNQNLKYKYITHWDDEAQNGEVVVLVSMPFLTENKRYEHYTQFRLLRFTKDMDISDNTLIDIGYAAYYSGGTATYGSDGKLTGTRLLFAPQNPGVIEVKPPANNRYVFVKTGSKGIIENRSNVDVSYPKWCVTDVVTSGSDTYFFGAAAGASTDWFVPFDANSTATMVLQVVKMSGGINSMYRLRLLVRWKVKW